MSVKFTFFAALSMVALSGVKAQSHSFTGNCTTWSGSGTTLTATCFTESGSSATSSLDLNTCFTSSQGEFVDDLVLGSYANALSRSLGIPKEVVFYPSILSYFLALIFDLQWQLQGLLLKHPHQPGVFSGRGHIVPLSSVLRHQWSRARYFNKYL